MAYNNNTLSGMMGDYAKLKTLPALLSVVFVVAGLYQFGGISDVTLNWGINYTLTAEAATISSLAVFAVAFMSSETRDFDSYDQWEMLMIGLSPVLIVGYQYVGFVQDIINGTSPTMSIIAFIITVLGWGVAVR